MVRANSWSVRDETRDWKFGAALETESRQICSSVMVLPMRRQNAASVVAIDVSR
jgi:hypothetical protein